MAGGAGQAWVGPAPVGHALVGPALEGRGLLLLSSSGRIWRLLEQLGLPKVGSPLTDALRLALPAVQAAAAAAQPQAEQLQQPGGYDPEAQYHAGYQDGQYPQQYMQYQEQPGYHAAEPGMNGNQGGGSGYYAQQVCGCMGRQGAGAAGACAAAEGAPACKEVRVHAVEQSPQHARWSLGHPARRRAS